MRCPSFVIPKPVQLSFRELTLCRKPHARVPVVPWAPCLHVRACRHCLTGAMAYVEEQRGHVCVNCARPGLVETACTNQEEARIEIAG